MTKKKIGSVGCPCCEKLADVREAKNGKPYIMCDDCGYQGFARGDAAVAGLRKKMKPLAAAKPGAKPTPEKADEQVDKPWYFR